MSVDDVTLLTRGAATLAASWAVYAGGSAGACLQRLPGVDAAVFPAEPERSVYANALLGRGLSSAARAAALDAMQDAYAAAGIRQFAACARGGGVPERPRARRRERGATAP